MKSIKPGRGPSRQSFVVGIFVIIFAIFWTIMALSMGAYIMVPFGILFIGIAIYQAIYAHHNATAEDRYSIIDIVDAEEESDPLNEIYGRKREKTDDQRRMESAESGISSDGYCPYCGSPVQKGFAFCSKCGKKLPE